MPRWLITTLVLLAAAVLTWALAVNANRRPDTKADLGTAPAAPEAASVAAGTPTPAEPAAPGTAPVTSTPPGAAEVTPIDGLHVLRVTETQPEPVIGSAAPDKNNPYPLEAKLTPWGGGILETRLSAPYSTDVVLQPEDFNPYPVQQRLVVQYVDGKPRYRYPMAAFAVNINGQNILLFNERWRVREPTKESVQFALDLVDGQGNVVAEITRTWRVEPRTAEGESHRYALYLDQRVENKSSKPLRVMFVQYGPMDLPKEHGYIGDQRHLILGYLKPRRASDVYDITTEDFDWPRDKVLSPKTADQLWPSPTMDERLDLAWAAMTNRYFAAAVHAQQDPGKPEVRPLESVFPTIRRLQWGEGKIEDQSLGLFLESASGELAPGATRRFDVALYAGPKSPDVLDNDPTYSALGLRQIIVYNLGGCCATCTFAWLANGLMAFLGLIHSLVRDWGVAIIVLVAVVRTLLHPLTKSSQVNMMKLSKQMGALAPELEKIKAKYGDNQTKVNQETMALYREKGVNPASMGLGCLPMFLQMPIWIALYAMLYFAIELRHEPAFWGVFQWISGGHWPFLADLSSQDNFIPLPSAVHFTLPFVQQRFTAINILPILMGVVFFVQQKYMVQPTPNMSEQMRQQQVMMKWMTVIMMPVLLFWAPSGLTLYILTSTAVGIVESKRVRRHVKELEESGKLHEKKPRKPGGLMDRVLKLAEAQQKKLEEQSRLQQRTGKKKNR